ncbi:exopolysaccharide biosynthesis protein [Cohaesibacter sp. ES.047]|uniref:exopolysaccharide biosynthesis protein n=1 Tax=Cohaesibacter sp. ES.047 TaxID=1798205 RepID=UPI0012FD962E|nr:exopolysaccharide biosynthesis protein [Cohaesibacter sp. ES.047]
MKLTDILKKIHKDTDGNKIEAGEMVDILEHRGFGPLLLAASLLTVLPTGGIPGVPTVTAILVILIAGQILFGRQCPWVPEFLRKRSIEKETFEQTRKKAEPYTKFFDRFLKPRLKGLMSSGVVKAVAVLCIVLACLMPPLEVVPFAAILPALAIALMAVSLSAKDGIVMIVGLVIASVGILTSGYLLF